MPFKGVLLSKSSDQSLVSDVETPVTWDAVVYETDDFFDASTSTTKIVIPSGVSFVRFSSQISWGVGTVPNWVTQYLIKNSVTTADPGGVYRLVEQPADNGFLINAGASAVISVAQNDFFELYAFFSGGSGVEVQGDASDLRTWFAMEVIE